MKHQLLFLVSATAAMYCVLDRTVAFADSPPESLNAEIRQIVLEGVRVQDDKTAALAWQAGVRASMQAKDVPRLTIIQEFIRVYGEGTGPEVDPTAFAMNVLVALESLHPTWEESIDAAYPLLDSANPDVVSAARECIQSPVEDLRPLYQQCRKVLLDGGPDRPGFAGLIKELFRKNSTLAVITLSSIYPELEGVRKALLLPATLGEVSARSANGYHITDLAPRSTEISDDLAQQLSTLANDSKWWLRLITTEILIELPAVKEAAIIDKLTSDSNSQVAETAKPLLKRLATSGKGEN